MSSHDDLHDRDLRVRAFESIRSDEGNIDPDALGSLANHPKAPVASHNGARVMARAQARARPAARIGTPTVP